MAVGTLTWTTASRRLWSLREGNTQNELLACSAGSKAQVGGHWSMLVRELRWEAGPRCDEAAGMYGPSSQEKGRTQRETSLTSSWITPLVLGRELVGTHQATLRRLS